MARRLTLELDEELLENFEHSLRVSELLVGAIPKQLWHAAPANGKGRTIAAIVAHMQGLRRTFAKMGGADPALPALDSKQSTPAEARRALAASRDALVALFRQAIADGRPRVKGMPRRTVNMMFYLTQHDAHHRGQISALVSALDQRLPGDVVMKLWGWKRLV